MKPDTRNALILVFAAWLLMIAVGCAALWVVDHWLPK